MNGIIRNKILFLCPNCIDRQFILQINNKCKLLTITVISRFSSNDSKDNGSNGKPRPRNGKDLDHYEVLGVDKRAQAKEIKDAYIKLSKVYHPDVNKSPEAIKLFQEVSTAYETIGNYDTRRNYDRKMFGQQLQTQIRKSAGGSSPSPFQSTSYRRTPGQGPKKPTDYTQSVYKDKMGREREYRSSMSAEESVSKNASEEELYFDTRTSTEISRKELMEMKAMEIKRNPNRTTLKEIKKFHEDHVNEVSNQEILAPILFVMVLLIGIYGYNELKSLKQLMDDGDSYGEKLMEKKKLDPNYLDNVKEVKVKYVNTDAYSQMIKSERK